MDKRETIVLLMPQKLPVPAVKGGAIEELVTTLLQINETNPHARFVVVSITDPAAVACSLHFQHTVFYYFNNSRCLNRKVRLTFYWSYFVLLLQRLFNRLLLRPIFHKKIEWINPLDTQCSKIMKMEHATKLVFEGRQSPLSFPKSIKNVGRKNAFMHVHNVFAAPENWITACPNILAVSRCALKEYVGASVFSSVKRVVWNGIDVKRFSIRVPSSEIQRRKNELNICEGSFVILYCGRISIEKGVIQLIDAFEALGQGPFVLILVGSSYAKDTNLENAYFDLVKRRSQANDRIIMTGYIDNNDLPSFYQLADLVVIPSICKDAAPLVTIEAMAARVPIVATKTGGIPEYLGANCAEFVEVSPSLADDLKDGILKLYKNKSRRDELVNKTTTRIASFTSECFYFRFINAILGK